MAKQVSEVTPAVLQAFLEEHEINASELSRRIGTTRGAVCRWLAGNRTPPPYLKQALQVVGVQLQSEKGFASWNVAGHSLKRASTF